MKRFIQFILTVHWIFLFVGVSCAADGLEKISDHVYAYAGTINPSSANSFGANAGIVIGDKGLLDSKHLYIKEQGLAGHGMVEVNESLIAYETLG
jgi:hypothetical protein